MPGPCPHPLALFSLHPVADSERAKAAFSHPDNDHLVSRSSDGNLALNIGFHIRGKSSKTLATLGRGFDADIYVEGSNIARIQCSFEIDFDTGIVMFCDRSLAKSSQVFGENAMPFEHKRIRQVLVNHKLNDIIGMGGERRDLIRFRLVWYQNPEKTVETIKNYKTLLCGRVENPRLARTMDEAPTSLPSCRETRPHTVHTARSLQLKMRYVTMRSAGSGTFGEVFKAIDVDSGKFMAVKILKRPTIISEAENWRVSVKREVEILSNISHPHIVDYIASQGWDGPRLEIFMGLKEGTLGSLIQSGADALTIAESVFGQMLQALDCTALKGIIHRDVKPENILYISHPGGQYQFQLGDFGLCNRAIDAATTVGSPIFMAPEMFPTGSQTAGQTGRQTSKIDVWSLFVTMLWTLDIRGFRQKEFRSLPDARAAILFAASKEEIVAEIREMAMVKPEERASAAQMLVKCYNGEGLSTPRHRIPALPIKPSPVVSVPTPAPQARTTKPKPRALQRNATGLMAATQAGVKKVRGRILPVNRAGLRVGVFHTGVGNR